MKDRIIIYSKKNGVNQWLPISGESLLGIEKVFDREQFKEHKPFAYALIDGVEIKLFTGQSKIDMRHETAKYIVDLMGNAEKSPVMVDKITELLSLLVS